jgi:hypothetical protein
LNRRSGNAGGFWLEKDLKHQKDELDGSSFLLAGTEFEG